MRLSRATAAGFTVVTGVLTTLGVQAATTAPASAASTCSVSVTAHRGVHDATHTENTRRSAIQAALRGANTLEGDLQLTKDGVWVFMHDPTVDRTTRGHGTISSMTWAQVHKLTTDDGVKGGVPSLSTLLDTMTHYPDVDLQLEIKPATVSTAAMKTLRETFARYLVAPRLLVTSFNTAPLAKLRGYSTNWKVAPISNTQILADTTQRYGTVAIVKAEAITPTYVREMHGRKLQVFGWVADSDATWDKLAATGVDGIATDDVPGSRTWCKS